MTKKSQKYFITIYLYNLRLMNEQGTHTHGETEMIIFKYMLIRYSNIDLIFRQTVERIPMDANFSLLAQSVIF